MASDRLFVSELYSNPSFKSKWWFDEDIYNEQTPLTIDNIDHILEKYCPHSAVYADFPDYLTNCHFKTIAPQVVGLDPIEHWVAVEQNGNTFEITDSSGAPRNSYYELNIKGLPRRITATQEGNIRQSPRSNACGFYAAFVCLGDYLYHDPLYFWKSYAPNVVTYKPINLQTFNKTNELEETDFYLHQNDISMFRHFKEMY